MLVAILIYKAIQKRKKFAFIHLKYLVKFLIKYLDSFAMQDIFHNCFKLIRCNPRLVITYTYFFKVVKVALELPLPQGVLLTNLSFGYS